MTISSTNRKAGPFTGNGVTVSLPFTFKVFAAGDVLAVSLDTATGVETVKVLTTDYSVTLNADQNTNPGGSVLMVVAPAAGTTTTLASKVANLQPTDLTNGGGFYPKVITDALDRSVIQVQQLSEKAERTVALPISTPPGVNPTLPTPVAGSFIGWDATATKLITYSGLASVGVSAAMTPFVTSATNAAARTALDVYSKTETDTLATPISQVRSIAASVASNALTLTINPTKIDFRSATATDGTVSSLNLAVAASLVVPNGATLGASSNIPARLALLAINNAGVIEPAVLNIAGGGNLTETGVISTSALSAGSDSAAVVYSTSARVNVAYRVLGVIDIVETTAGVWSAPPTLVQGAGGQAIVSIFGNANWTDVTGSRVVGNTYFNASDQPKLLDVSVESTGAGAFGLGINVGGYVLPNITAYASAAGYRANKTTVIPPKTLYIVTAPSAVIAAWFEKG